MKKFKLYPPLIVPIRQDLILQYCRVFRILRRDRAYKHVHTKYDSSFCFSKKIYFAKYYASYGPDGLFITKDPWILSWCPVCGGIINYYGTDIRHMISIITLSDKALRGELIL